MIIGRNLEFPIIMTAMNEETGKNRFPIVHAMLHVENVGDKFILVIDFSRLYNNADTKHNELVEVFTNELVKEIDDQFPHNTFIYKIKNEYFSLMKLTDKGPRTLVPSLIKVMS